MFTEDPSPSVVVRRFMAAATLIFGLIGLLVHDPRWFAASGAFGLMWTAWDFLGANLFGPLGTWLSGIWSGESEAQAAANLRPTLDDTIRLLEHHLQPGVSRSVVIESAIRLEEIYRTIKHDLVRAQAVLARARELLPDAVELKRDGSRE